MCRKHKDLLLLDEPKARTCSSSFWTMHESMIAAQRRLSLRRFRSSPLSRRCRSSSSPRLEVAACHPRGRRHSSVPLLAAVRCRRCSSSLVRLLSRQARSVRCDDSEAAGGRGRGRPLPRPAGRNRRAGFFAAARFGVLTNFLRQARKGPLGVRPAVRGTRTRPTLRGPGARVP